MKVVITGASGYIGGTLARRFAAAGHEVLGIDRIESPIPSSHRLIQASLNEPVDAEVFRHADLVVHCAHDMLPGSFRRNVDGTRKWANQARECGARNQLFLTSVSAHRCAPSEYGQAKFELESYFMEKGDRVIRPGLVAGPGGSFAAIVSMLRNKAIVPVPGANRIRLALTDIQTLTRVILDFEKLKKGTCYNLIQPDWPGFWDFASKVRRHFGAQGMAIPLNIHAAKLLLWVAGVLRYPLPATLNYASFCALEQSQKYGYESSYGILGLRALSLEELLEVYSGDMSGP
jgi:nucleoside-diphosphate-sugar epimerase